MFVPSQKSSLQSLLNRATVSKEHKSEGASVSLMYRLTGFLAPCFVRSQISGFICTSPCVSEVTEKALSKAHISANQSRSIH